MRGASKALPPAKNEQSGEAEKLPRALENARGRRNIPGRVERNTGDGRIEVRTPEGDITIRVKQREQAAQFKAGQPVEIDIRRGQPPRVVLRAAPELPRTTPAPQNAQTLQARYTATPLGLETGGPVLEKYPESHLLRSAALKGLSSGVELKTGDIVRLASEINASALQELSVPHNFSPPPSAFQTGSALSGQMSGAQSFVSQSFFLEVAAAPLSNAALNQPLNAPDNLSLTSRITSNDPDPWSASTFRLVAVTSPAATAQATSTASPVFSAPPAALPALPAAFSGFENSALSIPASYQGPASLNALQGQPEQPYATFKPAALDVGITGIQNIPKIAAPQNVTGAAQNVTAPSKEEIITTGHLRAGGLHATVLGLTQQGLPLLSISLPQNPLVTENFILQVAAQNIAPGSEIALIPVSEPGATAAAPGLGAPLMLSEFLRPGPWPVFENLMQHMNAHGQQAVQSTLSQVIPNAANPAQLGTAALFFVAAVRSGDIGGWLGERTMNILKRDARGNNILSRLTGELTTAGRVQAEAVTPDGWRAMPVPLAYQGEIHKAALYFRHQGGDDNKDGGHKEKQTRFIFDLSLSRMGGVQLDGLLREKRLDLALRTQRSLSETMRMDMKKLYAGALADTGFEGDIVFQDDPERFIRVLQEDRVVKVRAD